MIRLCGGSLALFAFAVTLVLGLVAGNPPEVILERGIYSLFIFCGLGLVVGWIGSRVLDEHAVGKHREMFPPEEAEGPPVLSPADETTARR